MIVLSKLKLEEIADIADYGKHIEFNFKDLVDYNNNIKNTMDGVKALLKLDERLDPPDNFLREYEHAADEIIENSIKHGNQSNPEKKIYIDILLQNNKSNENSSLYLVVRDEGKGFDIESPIYKNRREGGEGLGMAKIFFNFMYNFKDSSAYLVKAIPKKSQKYDFKIINADLTREKAVVGEIPPFCVYSNRGIQPEDVMKTVYVFDLHSLKELGDFPDNKAIPKNGVLIDFDSLTLERNDVLRSYAIVSMPEDDYETFIKNAKESNNAYLKLRSGDDRSKVDILTNSLFVSPVKDNGRIKYNPEFSYGLLPDFSKRKENLLNLFHNLDKKGVNK